MQKSIILIVQRLSSQKEIDCAQLDRSMNFGGDVANFVYFHIRARPAADLARSCRYSRWRPKMAAKNQFFAYNLKT